MPNQEEPFRLVRLRPLQYKHIKQGNWLFRLPLELLVELTVAGARYGHDENQKYSLLFNAFHMKILGISGSPRTGTSSRW